MKGGDRLTQLWQKTVRVDLLNILADEIDDAIHLLEEQNDQYDSNDHTICKLKNICDFLRDNQLSTSSSI